MGSVIELRENGAGFDLDYRGLRLIDGPFAYAGIGRESIDMYRGNFDVRDYVEERVPLAPDTITESGDGYRITLAAGAEGPRLVVLVRETGGRLELSFPEPCPGRNRFWFRFSA